MASQEVGDLLEECLQAAITTAGRSIHHTGAERLNYCSCRDSLCAELASLLQEAVEMKWPFVPEKWQYKQSISANDKTNLSDLVSRHLPQLLIFLKAAIMAEEAHAALAVVFIVDRFLYWTDESSRLLKITRVLHRGHPDAPVAPQLIIRQARVYLNSGTVDEGKPQKAGNILSRLINNSGATGCWVYHSESDRAVVQAVSVQVCGMLLQKLGLWLEAAGLIWASLVGYYKLPQPDKKGIGTSLGILANLLMSMNDEDFHAFRTNPDIDLSFLGDGGHRLLSAAEAAKMAVVYSQYTSLYVLTNVAIQGTCLLSYSFSLACPSTQRRLFLLQAKEAFVIGLLTKTEGELVTSKQELHTFIKAAYSLAVTHKWLGAPSEVVTQATKACQKALAHFYDYCHADTQDKDVSCIEIMGLIAQVKLLLHVEPILNSDRGSFIPDSYRNIKDRSIHFTLEGFSNVMQRYQKYLSSLRETTNSNCKGSKDQIDGARLCITALGTTVGTLNTVCSTEACSLSKDTSKGEGPQQGSSNASLLSQHMPDLCSTLGSTDSLGSSWQNFSLSSSGSPRPSGGDKGSRAIIHEANTSNQSCLTTEDDDRSGSMQGSSDKNKKRDFVSSSTVPRSEIPGTSSSSLSHDSEKFEVIEAAIETLDTDAEGAVQSLSQLQLRTSSSSLSDSFGSQSSWEKISADLNSPTYRKPQTPNIAKGGICKLPESNGSFSLMGTLDSESSNSARNPMLTNRTSGLECGDMSKPRPLNTTSDAIINSMVDSTLPERCATTETSTENSFEILEVNQSVKSHDEVASAESVIVAQRKNPWCRSCLQHSSVGAAAPGTQYLLSQEDYFSLLAGVCHECLLKRLHSDKTQFKLKSYETAHSALHLKFSKATGLWTAMETCLYIGQPMKLQGKQRTAIWVQFLHQEERLSSYVGKDYLKPKEIQFHLKDVERQMTAQYYVTEFNKSLYDKDVMAQIFFIPSEALLILNGNELVGCVTVEPFMLGDFVKLTNNTGKKDKSFQATEYGLAFGHFTYLFSECQEVVVDLQGWVTGNGKGLTYLTDPQIHSTKTSKGPANFADRGIRYFLEEQHGPECNSICQKLKLPPVTKHPRVLPQ